MEKSYFQTLNEVNVNEHVEQKNGLNYLSWAWAWQEFLKVFPDATYEIKKFTNQITGKITTYLEDEELGFMVYTSITANGITREMWLPVMDGANKAMKRQPYEYTVKKGNQQYTKQVEAASMFDVNKTIMRCLTKNIAMFGLGLYIYAGEDLPEAEVKAQEEENKARAEKLERDKYSDAILKHMPELTEYYKANGRELKIDLEHDDLIILKRNYNLVLKLTQNK